MFFIKVAYDACNQQFRLMDPELSHMFEDGDTYMLIVDFFPENPKIEGQFIDLTQAETGHA